ncbi:hypothetical protein CQA53_11330, partial [Helicobacter didelphidarum]
MIDSHNNIIWQSQRQYHVIGVFQYALYIILGIFMCWFCLFVLLHESLWYGLLALVFCFEIYKALNFKSMFLNNKGLFIQTRFSGNVFYPYGSFAICYSLATGIRFFERIEIYGVNHRNKIFLFPCGYDSLGSFKNNQEFKELCAKYTQNALETMDTKSRVALFLKYYEHIEIIFN